MKHNGQEPTRATGTPSLAASRCAFLVYSVITGSQRRVASPADISADCALLFVSGTVAKNHTTAAGWTLVDADAFLGPRGALGAAPDSNPRRASRVLKIQSHLLHTTVPTLYIDTKKGIRSMRPVRVLIQQMRACGASMLTYRHELRATSLLQEYTAIIKAHRSYNLTEVRQDASRVRDSAALSALEEQGRFVVNDGSFLLRIMTPALAAFERRWFDVYMSSCDRDQPAFALAYAAWSNGTQPSFGCGGLVWLPPHRGDRSTRMLGHDTFYK